MSRALVVYESMFGNTELIARAIAAGLGLPAEDCVEVNSAPSEIGPEVDLLVVGGPTHTFGMTHPNTRAAAVEQGAQEGHAIEPGALGVREWLDGLAPLQSGIAVAAFDTKFR